MEITNFKSNLEKLGYAVSYFDTKEQATHYLNQQIDGTSVAFGGSVTLDQMNLYPTLSTHNDVKWHWETVENRVPPDQARTQKVYITSINGAAESGELINIDGRGNRVSASIFGGEKVYFVFSSNKIEPDFEKALWRARNIAAPLNAKRLNRKTPCAVRGDKCYNCNSPERICRTLVVHWTPSAGLQSEVVIIGEELGY